jgi:uncharacterized protein YunC (DUF1805 family)
VRSGEKAFPEQQGGGGVAEEHRQQPMRHFGKEYGQQSSLLALLLSCLGMAIKGLPLPNIGHKAGFYAMASIKAPTTLLLLACEHCYVQGGRRFLMRMAKVRIHRCKAEGISTLPDLLDMARQEGDLDLRAAILFRLADRLSHNNVLKLALNIEADCCLKCAR